MWTRVVLTVVGLLLVIGLAKSALSSSPPGPPVQTFSGVGTVKLGTIVVPTGGAVLEWHCPACSVLGASFDIGNNWNNANQLATGSMNAGSMFQDHPTHGANNSVMAGTYTDVTTTTLTSPVAWSFTITPKD
jgi:hypothetical protein